MSKSLVKCQGGYTLSPRVLHKFAYIFTPHINPEMDVPVSPENEE